VNIWIFSTEMPSFRPGGIARYVDRFASLAAHAGHEVTVLAPVKNAEEIGSPAYRVVPFDDRADTVSPSQAGAEPDAHPDWPHNNMTYFAALSHRFALEAEALAEREGPPDIIECQDYGATGYFLLHRRLTGESPLRHTPVVVHLHTPDFIVQRLNQYPRYKLPAYWIGRMERAAIWMADAVLAPSTAMLTEMHRHLEGPLPETAIIPYPLGEVSDAGPVEPKEGHLLFVGRIELRKGVEPLLAACDPLWRDGLSFTVEMAGADVHTPLKGGNLTTYLQKRYKRHVSEGRLRFSGPLSHDEVARRMRAAHAVLVPSLWENFPHVCMEAMAAGACVLAAREGGQAEMLEGSPAAGFLFSHGQPGSLEERLREVLAMSLEERRAMGRTASERIRERGDPEKVLRDRLGHFRKVIGRGTERRTFPFPNRRLREGVTAPAISAAPLLSVVIPYYNLGRYLRECLDSVLAAADVRKEILIVNDGSTEPESLQVLGNIRRRDLPEVRILDIPNGGLANARNRGALEARGELVAFVDADDAVEPSFLRRAAEVFRRYDNVHLVYSWARFFGEGKGIWHAWTFDLPYLLCHNQLIPIAVVRRETFLRHGRNKPHIVYGLEDYEGWLSLAEAGCGGVAIPEPLVRYRIRDDSMFKVIERDKQLYLYDLIAEEHPGLYGTYGKELFGILNANGPAHSFDQPTMFGAPYDQICDKAEIADALQLEVRSLREAEQWLHGERKRLMEAAGEALPPEYRE
jgi:glycosyltransferase involved in cell wall biosynthesis